MFKKEHPTNLLQMNLSVSELKTKTKKSSLMNPLIGPLFNILQNLFIHIHTYQSKSGLVELHFFDHIPIIL